MRNAANDVTEEQPEATVNAIQEFCIANGTR